MPPSESAAEVEVGWSARTCAALGWEPVARMRRYCRPCFDSKKMLHPRDSADEIKAVARA